MGSRSVPNAGVLLYKTKEFASLAGVSVRALHHYDQLGLLKPTHRSNSGYRLYSRNDLARLEQIVVLRFMGLSLLKIGEVLSGKVEISRTLSQQQAALSEHRAFVDRVISLISKARESVSEHDDSAWRLLLPIIKEINMQQEKAWMEAYLSEGAKAAIAERRESWTPELREENNRKWKQLFADVEASLDADPASDTAQSLAARAFALIGEFTGGNAEIHTGLAAAYSDRPNWPEGFRMPGSPAVNEFLRKAIRARNRDS
jgi:DNA-binding transcriptional MerR regulator